jgi:hypothetical protein
LSCTGNREVLSAPWKEGSGARACPEVEIAGDEVRIGESGNLAVLKKEEWNVLVDLIQSGQLGRV